LAASLDGFIARKDGSVDWLETSDEFADGATADPGFVEAFLKAIDCYVMGSRTPGLSASASLSAREGMLILSGSLWPWHD
jgi:hypothetical protein